ncbi:hypothetical protein A6769_38010 [Nostoc punctiforme NIES-2108]|uniref:Uncharacterized protein n=1 Tax=Nostoc punctiforme NIES-2108 TaxID=1356359 RepID=A0A367S285_NOSPU|nr:hypothetical protein A6769_38010 [Nostoc punctiforme NIES-2108]
MCEPVDGYRLTYVGRTNLQTAHNVYLNGEFLGIIFKVRNADEVWENDPKTYYWQCSNGMKYWSVKEAVEALSRATAPIELPQIRRELVARVSEMVGFHTHHATITNPFKIKYSSPLKHE